MDMWLQLQIIVKVKILLIMEINYNLFIKRRETTINTGQKV